jgi:hypothetical protein
MCMFCAAIPMTASLGVAVTANRQKRRQQALKTEKPPITFIISPGKATTVLVITLVMSSAIYHTIIAPQTGVFI